MKAALIVAIALLTPPGSARAQARYETPPTALLASVQAIAGPTAQRCGTTTSSADSDVVWFCLEAALLSLRPFFSLEGGHNNWTAIARGPVLRTYYLYLPDDSSQPDVRECLQFNVGFGSHGLREWYCKARRFP